MGDQYGGMRGRGRGGMYGRGRGFGPPGEFGEEPGFEGFRGRGMRGGMRGRGGGRGGLPMEGWF